MKAKNFSAFDHILVNCIDELFRKEKKYLYFNFHKGGSSFLTINLTDNTGNVTRTAFLMTEDDLPEKIKRDDYTNCFLDNTFPEISDKTIFLCKINSQNQILDSKHYYHNTHFL